MKPNCHKCKHYFITFDKYASKGCKIFNIKSNTLPSLIVKQAHGSECQGFTSKVKKKKDLNDSSLW